MSSAAPDCWIATDSGNSPPTMTTVVQEMPPYARPGVSTRSSTMASAASRPATAAGTTPVASSATIPASTPRAFQAGGPSGAACVLTSAGGSTTRTWSGRSSLRSRACQLPCTSRVSPAASSAGPERAPAPAAVSRPERWTARITRLPSAVAIPGKTAVPIRLERGLTTTSTSPVSRLTRTSARCSCSGAGRWSSPCCSAKASVFAGPPRTIRMSPAWSAASPRGSWPSAVSAPTTASPGGAVAASASERLPTAGERAGTWRLAESVSSP